MEEKWQSGNTVTRKSCKSIVWSPSLLTKLRHSSNKTPGGRKQVMLITLTAEAAVQMCVGVIISWRRTHTWVRICVVTVRTLAVVCFKKYAGKSNCEERRLRKSGSLLKNEFCSAISGESVDVCDCMCVCI